jgi:hypothetical protein
VKSLALRVEAAIMFNQALTAKEGDAQYVMYRQLQAIADIHSHVHVCTRGEFGGTQLAQANIEVDGNGHAPCVTMLAVAKAVGVDP